MRRLILAAPFLVFPFLSGSAQAACPATLTDCPSVNANRGSFGGEVQVGDASGTQTAGTVLNIPTFSALRAFQPDALVKTQTVHTEGYAAPADGGGATYDWDPNSTCPSNGANVICVVPTGSTHSTTGRWELRMPGGIVNARVHGLKCDGVTDDSAQLNTLLAEVSQIGGGTVVLPATAASSGPNGCVVSGANVVMRKGVTLQGAVGVYSGPQAFPQYSNSMLLLDPSRSITMIDGATLKNLVVWRLGLALQPANVNNVINAVNQWNNESSTAVTLTSNSVLEDVRIGFHLAMRQTGGGGNFLRNVEFDAANGLERSGALATTYIDGLIANSWWAPEFGGRAGVISATPTAGSGYTTGNVVQPSGGTCTIQPTFTVTASGGTPTQLTVTNVGDCTTYPTGTSFTGGTGSGLQATLGWQSGGYRPGIFYYDHDGGGGTISHFIAENFQIGIRVDNSVIFARDGLIEGAEPYSPGKHAQGILTEHCSDTQFSDVVVTANYDNLTFNAASDQSGASCGSGLVVIGITRFTGGYMGTAYPNFHSNITIGAGATAVIQNTRLSAGNNGGTDVVVGANASVSLTGTAMNVISMSKPWMVADPTAKVSTCGGVGDGTATLSSISYVDTCQQVGASLSLATKTVATLPTCNAAAKNQLYAVSDAASPVYNATLTGGGATLVMALCDGVSWKTH